jgi:hypothetical protein
MLKRSVSCLAGFKSVGVTVGGKTNVCTGKWEPYAFTEALNRCILNGPPTNNNNNKKDAFICIFVPSTLATSPLGTCYYNSL